MGIIKTYIKENQKLFAFITALVFITFIRGINGAFVSDDLPAIVNNPQLTNYTTALQSGQLQVMIQGTIYKIFGENVVPFHLVSMILHLLNIFLFFIIISELFNKKVATYSSMLYAIHPVTAETVLWISAQNYLINTLILYLVVISYIKRKQPYPVGLFSLYLFLPLVFPNFWVYLTPFILLALELLFLSKNPKEALKLLPLFGICAIHFLLRGASHVGTRVDTGLAFSLTSYLERIPFSVYMPWELFIWPKDLTIYHEGQIISAFKNSMMIVTTLLTVAGTTIMFFKKNLRKYANLIILIFIATLPIFSPIQVAWFVAERYLYISVGFFTVLVSLILVGIETRYSLKKFTITFTAILLVAYSARTIIRTNDWKTRKSLWIATEKIGPNSSKVNNNLGHIYQTEEDYEKSIHYYQRAIELNPEFFYAMNNLANTYIKADDIDNAEIYLNRALELEPELFPAIHKLGIVAYLRGDNEKALEYFKKTLELQPGYIPTIQALQILQQKTR